MTATSDETWDVVVVGGGPAGSVSAIAALHARPQARVLILDREDFPRDKVCGDGVAAHTFGVLEPFGLADIAGDYKAGTEMTLAYRDVRARNELRHPLTVIPRQVFDARLVDAAVARGAVLRRHRMRELEVRPDSVVIDGSITGRVVIGADGAESMVRRQVHAQRAEMPGTTAVALRAYAPSAATHAAILGAGADWPVYAWEFPVGDAGGNANIGVIDVPRPDKEVTRASLLATARRLLPDYDHDQLTWRAHRLPMSNGRPRQPDGRVLLVGDAASLINPMSGEGIFYAVLSGALAGEAAASGANAGRIYREALDARLGHHLRHTAVAVQAIRTGPFARYGFAMARADRDWFNQLIDVSMGDGVVKIRTGLRALARAVLQH